MGNEERDLRDADLRHLLERIVEVRLERIEILERRLATVTALVPEVELLRDAVWPCRQLMLINTANRLNELADRICDWHEGRKRMTPASRQFVDDLPQMWTLDIEATAKVLQALWNYYAAQAERGLARRAHDRSQEQVGYVASLAAWEQLFRCIDEYADPKVSGAWKALMKDE